MRMFVLIALLLTASCQPHAGEEQSSGAVMGRYNGHLEYKGKSLAVSIAFDTAHGRPVALLTIPANLQLDKPFDEVRYDHPQMALQMRDGEGAVNIQAVFSESGDVLEGKLDGPLPAKLRLVKDEGKHQSVRNYVTVDTVLVNGKTKLPARLFLPKISKPVPAVILISGTGNHRKEEYNGWANLFAGRGIAALIFDKRNVTDVAGRNLHYVNSDITTLDELLGDAETAYAVLRSQRNIDPMRIGVMGFSLGAVEAPVLAARNPRLSFLVVVSGNATTDRDYIMYQGLSKYRIQGFDASTQTKALQLYHTLFRYVQKRQGKDSLQAALDKAWQEGWGQLCFPKEVPNDDEIKHLLGWNNLDFDPADYWSQLHVPSFVVYGEKDSYVPVDSSIAILTRIFAAKKSLLTLKRYPGTDHTIRTIPSGRDFEFPVYPARYPSDVVNWVQQQTAKTSRR